eukprot:1790286-Rhodomonas_salina.1
MACASASRRKEVLPCCATLRVQGAVPLHAMLSLHTPCCLFTPHSASSHLTAPLRHRHHWKNVCLVQSAFYYDAKHGTELACGSMGST